MSTEPETAAEAGSFDALRPTVAQCLLKGRTLAFGKLVLRGTIALNYYRLAHATFGVEPMMAPRRAFSFH